MKAVYTWDANNLYIPTANKVVPDDYTLGAQETFEEPKDAQGHGLLMPIKRTANGWVGASQEEYQAAHPAEQPKPSETTVALTGLSAQVMALSKRVDELEKGGAKQ